jgi:hypothetical protein
MNSLRVEIHYEYFISLFTLNPVFHHLQLLMVDINICIISVQMQEVNLYLLNFI